MNDSSISNPTLSDVAKLAGVSVSTASRALAGSTGIASKTAQRVREAAQKIGYPLERRSQREDTASLGIIVANVASPIYATLVQAVEDAALRQGYNIILCNSNYDAEREQKYLEILMQKGVEGIIVAPIETKEPFMERLLQRGIPIVQMDRYVEHLKCDVVISDNVQGAQKAVQFLLQQGYERIGIISGPHSHSTGRDRLAGYLQALRGSGRPVKEDLIKIGDFKKGSAYRLTLELLEAAHPPDALFVTNCDMTTGALVALHDRGLVMPEDIGLVGFDEFEHASLLMPPLTVVEQPLYMMGATAADLLIRRVEENTRHSEPVTIRLETRLIVRQSTRCISADGVQPEEIPQAQPRLSTEKESDDIMARRRQQ